jgi:membrane protease YdiL (CAAX protease family)
LLTFSAAPYINQPLAPCPGPPKKVALSSVAFAAAHPPAAAPAELLLGLALGAAVIAARGNLAAPVIGHCLYNGAVLGAGALLAALH